MRIIFVYNLKYARTTLNKLLNNSGLTIFDKVVAQIREVDSQFAIANFVADAYSKEEKKHG